MIKNLFIICTIFLVACGKNTPPENLQSEPFYKQGIKAFESGNFSVAKNSFLQSAKRGRNFATFLPLAQIYEKEKDYELAIFYYRQYLNFLPQGDVNKPAISVMLENVRKELHNSKSEGEKESIEILKKQLAKIQEENRILQNKLLAKNFNSIPVIPPLPISKVEASPLSPTPIKKISESTSVKATYLAEYVVQKGDSLSVISMKFYNTSKHWNKILNANRDILLNESQLKIGQKLKIPHL